MKYFFLYVVFLSSCSILKGPEVKFSSTQKLGKEEDYFLNAWKPVFLTLDSEIKKLPDFPRLNSESFKREKMYLLSIERSRTFEDEKVIEFQKHVCGFYFDGFRIGFNLQLDELLMDAYMDARLFGFQAKKHFDRARPSYVIRDIKKSIRNPDHASYPSNHSIQAVLMAYILSDVFPMRKSRIISSAKNIARNRELAGVHFPSDSDLGISMASIVYEKLKDNSDFSARLKKIQLNSQQLVLRKVEFSKLDYDVCKKYTNSYAIRSQVWKQN